MEMICKAMHTESSEFLNVVKQDEMIYALTDDELEDENSRMPRVNEYEVEDIKGTYKHFKNKNYEVLGTAFDMAGDKYVFYKALYDTDIKFYLRPYEMFFSPVDKVKYPDASQEMRFEKMD